MLTETLQWAPIFISLFIAGFNAAMFIVLKFNDLKHLEISVKELTETLKETNRAMVENAKEVSKLKGRCEANHGS